MSMIEVRTADLIGPALDWAVAKGVGLSLTEDCGQFVAEEGAIYLGRVGREYSPSTNWSQGGTLIEKYQVRFDHRRIDCGKVIASACGMMFDHGIPGCDSYLVAAMRAIVAAKLGDVVSVPAELVSK